jgi:cytochrome c5
MAHRPALLALAFTLLAAGCTATPLGATPEHLTQARELPGASVYRRECASCHGERGEGLGQTPPVMGASALPTYERDPSMLSNPALQSLSEQQREKNLPPGATLRKPFKTAADLYAFVSKEMPLPKGKAGTLSAEDYWAVVNFLLVGHGVAVPAGGVTADNAASVRMR